MPKGIFPHKRTPEAERFWPKVDKNGPVPEFAPHLGPCWIWTSTRVPKGYGMFRAADGQMPAHRWAWERSHESIASGLVVDHLCRVRLCVNPAHLELVTTAENTRRGLHGALKTHCAQGHDWSDPRNVGRNVTSGQRYCLECDRLRSRGERGRERRERRRRRLAEGP